MSAATRIARAERKALLVARAELERTRIALVVHEIRTIVAPTPSPERVLRLRPVATALVAVAGPLFGFRRLSRLLRFASLAMFVLRAARGWSG